MHKLWHECDLRLNSTSNSINPSLTLNVRLALKCKLVTSTVALYTEVWICLWHWSKDVQSKCLCHKTFFSSSLTKRQTLSFTSFSGTSNVCEQGELSSVRGSTQALKAKFSLFTRNVSRTNALAYFAFSQGPKKKKFHHVLTQLQQSLHFELKKKTIYFIVV